MSAYFLLAGLHSQGPLTRFSVFNISLGVCLLFFAATSFTIEGELLVLQAIAGKITQLEEMHVTTLDALKILFKRLEKRIPEEGIRATERSKEPPASS